MQTQEQIEIQQTFLKKIEMLKPEYKNRFLKEQSEHFETIIFEGEISEQMPRFRQFAFMHESEMQLNISYKYWRYISFGSIKEYNLNDISTFLIAAERRIFFDWLKTYGGGTEAINQFDEFKLCIQSISEKANPIIEEFSIKLVDSLLKIQHIEVSGLGNSGEYKKGKIQLSK